MSEESVDISNLLLSARDSARVLARTSLHQRNRALQLVASTLRHEKDAILQANRRDVDTAAGSPAMVERLSLNPERVHAIAEGIEAIVDAPDPLSRVSAEWTRPNGLNIRRVSVAIGVIGMVYESRPNVGADAAALCIKSGNALILRGGSESFYSNQAIHYAISVGIKDAGLPSAAVQSMPSPDRRYVEAMLKASGGIDLLIPRGGKNLVDYVQRESRVPVLAHAEGLCHTYVDKSAVYEMACKIVLNAKMRRVSICSATETLLIDSKFDPAHFAGLVNALQSAGCLCVADDRAREILPTLPQAENGDFDREWLAPKLSICIVDGVRGAISHINRHGSGHTEAIIAADEDVANEFMRGVDSAVVMWNTSTQFCDGGEFGFGAEIGISTGRLHARGPVGPEQLTTYRYEVRGDGQTRA